MKWLKNRVRMFVGNLIRSEVSIMNSKLQNIDTKIDELKILTARTNNTKMDIDDIKDAEYKVFSQFGDDGIIQYLISTLNIKNETFIEFGVEDYRESNTRYLLVNNNWSGLVIDGDENNIKFIKNDNIYWRHELKAISSFITRENINELIATNGFNGEIGLLSIDIDGNDFWIWEAINVVDPIIVVIEYNSLFGNKHALTVPYEKDFQRTKAHHSNLYWGCSIKALHILATKKNYIFIGCNSNGNNAYFIRKDKIGDLKERSIEDGYIRSKFRESRDKNGELTFLTHDERLKEISDMKVYDIEKDAMIKIMELL